ncbi:hypothetical protein BT63DRAFT_419381 [Microthyrium microscopicum]|uniref:Secreted protein n=1 Tax=Microthyrium microscopicum TaxID=703497 RepID=A0A6A6URM5_9PEZI|nr:hypothetical protein BT63DRAFT_419381 [Microthyrium microscopicum]
MPAKSISVSALWSCLPITLYLHISRLSNISCTREAATAIDFQHRIATTFPFRVTFSQYNSLTQVPYDHLTSNHCRSLFAYTEQLYTTDVYHMWTLQGGPELQIPEL